MKRNKMAEEQLARTTGMVSGIVGMGIAEGAAGALPCGSTVGMVAHQVPAIGSLSLLGMAGTAPRQHRHRKGKRGR
jgi:hypothetical protein